ncbi:DUF2634 domain-containing protein [Lysinibacillus sp. 54212]|uniref:DUF2634 domain-containing protein n=1 Tax=Lysinibacillus sp. 54212 TaxID=3119829 RepID=UPI002FC9A45D
MSEQDKRVPVFDWEKGDFIRDMQGNVKTVSGAEAVQHITMKALNTIRGVYLIYADLDNEDLHHKYGSDVDLVKKQDISDEVKLEEMKRAIVEALIYDPWITDVLDVEVSRSSLEGRNETDAAYMSCTIKSIFGVDVQLEGVSLNG